MKALVLGSCLRGLMLSNGSLGAKIGAKCAQMEAWRVQNGGPMGQDGGQEGAKCHPKGLREAPAPLGARQVDAKRRPRGPRTGSCTFLRPILGPQRRRKGAEIAPKSGPKAIPKRASFQITFRDRFLSILRSEKHHFRDMKRTLSTFQSKKANKQKVLEKPI